MKACRKIRQQALAHMPIGCAVLLMISLAASRAAHAYKTNFSETHWGVEIGGGTYFFPYSIKNLYDPVPNLAPSGVTASDSNGYYLVPLKFGYFQDLKDLSFEVFLRYMINYPNTAWTATGSVTGSGHTRFSSLGAGAGANLNVWNSKRLRIGLAARMEYVKEKVALTFSGSSGNEKLALSSTAFLYGVGLQPEIWLGDFYSLSIFGGYLTASKKTWNVSKAATFMGASHAAGASTVPSQHGGLLVEATFRLNFF
jgi:hypothetical protein